MFSFFFGIFHTFTVLSVMILSKQICSPPFLMSQLDSSMAVVTSK